MENKSKRGKKMDIISFEKVSLQDYPEKISAICYISGCQLRCPYCHNPSLVLPEIYGDRGVDMEKEFIDYLDKRKNILEGVVISGGEPLLKGDLVDLIYKIKEMSLAVKLDTNGMSPDKLKSLIEEDLIDYIALDYKGESSSFRSAVGLSKITSEKDLYSKWKQSLEIIYNSNIAYEIRTTIVKEIHTKEALRRMAEELKILAPNGDLKWYLQRYEEDTDVLNKFTKSEKILSSYSKEDMQAIKDNLQKNIPGVSLR